MQKIMFNDEYLLTQAVLERRKTKTRRIAEKILIEDENGYLCWNGKFKRPRYNIGDVVAIAQSYEDVFYEFAEIVYIANKQTPDNFKAFGKESEATLRSCPGWTNKMFVRADLMPHHIRFTDYSIERLQDIGDEDCLREGIISDLGVYSFNDYEGFKTPQLAFKALINRISGKGTWESNPWVYVYEFELLEP